MIPVGEEYDPGWLYRGVNSARRLDEITWSHWLSSPSPFPPRAERSIMTYLGILWTRLSHSAPYTIAFDASGAYARSVVGLYLSGLPASEAMRVELDGVDLGWEARPGIGVDLWYYEVGVGGKLEKGTHTLAFYLGEAADEKVAQLCGVEVMEFGDEDECGLFFILQRGC